MPPWLLEGFDLLPSERSGFSCGHGTLNCIADLHFALEDFKQRGETSVAVFLNTERAFDFVPHDVILPSHSEHVLFFRRFIFQPKILCLFWRYHKLGASA